MGGMDKQKEVRGLDKKDRMKTRKITTYATAAALAFAAFVSSPEHIFNRGAPLPLAFTI